MNLKDQRSKRGLNSFTTARIFLVLWASWISGQQVYSDENNTLGEFQTKVLNLIQRPKWDSAFWGIEIVSLDDGTTLYSLNAQKRFLPASNMKILTCAAILDGMDPQERITTPVYVTGRIDKWGRVLGDLVVVGRGDPNLERRGYKTEHEPFENKDYPSSITQIADELQSKGIKTIEGDIVIDDTYFLHQPFGLAWTIEDTAWSYGAPVSALVINENMIAVKILPGEHFNDLALFQTSPTETASKMVMNRVKTIASQQNTKVSLTHEQESGLPLFTGSISQSQSELNYQVAVPDPTRFAGSLLKAALTQRGVLVKGDVKSRILEPTEALQGQEIPLRDLRLGQPTYAEEARVAAILGVPIFDSLKIMMKESQNLYAECLLRLLGARTSSVGSMEAGLAALGKFMTKTGTPENSLKIKDASGMSRKNLVTPESIVRVLVYMDHHPQREKFLDTFPIGGKDGTLKTRFQGTSAAGRILAKTGSIESVSTLSGYAQARQGAHFAFSLMVNNEEGSQQDVREVLDQLCLWIIDFAPKTKNAPASPRQSQ
jgi:D-alanyl-D-alanine carboxypeptidase/D-alanyl-D-alanine-endopeptidase (penicillin-binding protein 4)